MSGKQRNQVGLGRISRRSLLSRAAAACSTCALAVATTAVPRPACAAVFSLKAVALNGEAITPTSALTVTPGDLIDAEIQLAGWAKDLPLGVQTIQAALAGEDGALSGDNGTVQACGWDAPIFWIDCDTDGDCPLEYPLCGARQACQGPNHDPEACAFIDTAHPAFPFAGMNVQVAVSTTVSLNYRYGIVLEDETAVLDEGIPVYCGTLQLVVSPDACGEFTIGFQPFENFVTFIAGPADPSKTVYPETMALTLSVEGCVPLLLSCDPGHCDIDARVPHSPQNPADRLNARSVTMNFSEPTAGMTPSDFEVTLSPNVGILPGVSSVTPSGTSAVVELNRRIAPQQWTCIRHRDSGRQCCMGSLPADADSSRLSEAADVSELVDHLLGATSALGVQRCDTDRSGLCAPGDVLMAVDLLNGADAFEPYAGAELPACPPPIPPP